MSHRCLSLLLLVSLVALVGPASAADQAIIVLDASGSMWGQIDGKAKIEIARESLDGVLASVRGELALGLLAYGHRKKGDCADIELLVPPAAGTGNEIVSAARALNPKGKTPLSDAVARAAEILKYREEAATVILITDGLETCDRDPCALGETLASTGVDFTAHVVGFGLSEEEGRQVACLAENTGGMYLAASDAEQLGAALSQTVAVTTDPQPEPEPEAPPPPPASLSAEDAVSQASRFTVGWEGPGDRYDSIQIFDPEARAGDGKVVRTANLHHGDVEAREVRMTAPAKLGRFQLRYWDGRGRRVLAARDFEVAEAVVSLSAPETVEVGRQILVEWQGPGGRYDAVEIYDPSAMNGEGKVLRAKRLRNDDFDAHRATLPAPGAPGAYVLRYWNGENKTVLAERPIEVVEGEVSLTADDQIEAGRTIRVEWTGPGGNYDSVQIFDPAARNGEGKVLRDKRLRNDDFENRRASLPAPAKAGPYELRYWNGDNKVVLATRPIEVTTSEVSLSAPSEVAAGDSFVVAWVGPGANYDDVKIVDSAGKPAGGRRLRNGQFDEQKIQLKAPATAGSYELQYWNGENKAVLATRALIVR